MLNLKIGAKEYNIKFGYKPTLKAGIISRIVEHRKENGEKIESVEDMLLFIPEVLLVGSQKNHKDEFGYNYDTNEGKDEALDKVFDLVDVYLESENVSISQLYSDLQEELFAESFLKNLLSQDENEQKEVEAKKAPHRNSKTAKKN